MSGTPIERRDFLVELGTEELPPKALPALELAFAEGLRSRLEQAGLLGRSLQSFATPRRLAVLVRGLPARTADQLINQRGPSVAASFDAGGAPTRAALAFATRCGVSPEALRRERDAKGQEYLVYEGIKAGRDTASLLPSLVQQSLNALPVPKRMRWGAGEAQFVRPVHWLLMLYGRETLQASVLDVPAGDLTRGHRFMADKALRITAPSGYARTLQTRGRVLASFAGRRAEIRRQVEALAATLGGQALIGDALLDEVTALVEWPVALAGSFEERFLALPREVLISTLQEHQRYFALAGKDGALLPTFITLSNIDSPEPELVREGNERVVRPRLADAAFFYEQDRREPLAARGAALETVTYRAKLGSMGARVARLESLAQAIAHRLNADGATAVRAAQLCKCDLLTAMVGEFPELQGIMGRYYALADGEVPAVADAIRDHYLPRGAGDALPGAAVGDALALADKLDALAGSFAIGEKPSGTSDPYGLRRAAIGVVRIVLEHRLDLDLIELIDLAVRTQPLADIGQRGSLVTAEVYDYLLERLRAQYLDGAAVQQGERISTELFDAVLATRPASLLDFDARLQALARFVAGAEGAGLAADNKRIANILRKSQVAQTQSIDAALLREPAEQSLHGALGALRGDVTAAVAQRDYQRALNRLAGLKPQVGAFFDQVLVNDPDQALRNNRLALLADLRALFAGIADLSCLPG